MQEHPSGSPAYAPPADFGRYQNLTYLGQGGMARVYKAYDPTLARSVALKFLRSHDPDMEQRLLIEAKAQARIDHEYVCRVYETGQVDGHWFIAMQYIAGRNLKELIGELSLEEKVKIIKEVSEGV